VVLVVVGCATIAANLIGLLREPGDGLARPAIAFVYGIAAVAAGVGLRRRMRSSRLAYLVWCMTIPLFAMTFREARDAYLIPSYIVLLFLLARGYVLVSRYSREGVPEPKRGVPES
jgi:hypothetical protein